MNNIAGNINKFSTVSLTSPGFRLAIAALLLMMTVGTASRTTAENIAGYKYLEDLSHFGGK